MNNLKPASNAAIVVISCHNLLPKQQIRIFPIPKKQPPLIPAKKHLNTLDYAAFIGNGE
jgi:hypothetical protein